MARLKELKLYKRQGKTWVLLDFTNPKADLLNYPNGVIFRKGYRSNQTAEKKLSELRAAWWKDLISEDSMARRMHHREAIEF